MKKTHCKWNDGDVFAYPLESEYAKEKKLAGKYFLIQKIDESFWGNDSCVIVYIKIAETLPENAEQFDHLNYVQVSSTRYEDRVLPLDGRRPLDEQIKEKTSKKYLVDEFGFLPEFRLCLVNSSQRVIPKKLIYVGNYSNITPPKIEYIHSDMISTKFITWKCFEKKLIDSYCGHNLRQYEQYSPQYDLEKHPPLIAPILEYLDPKLVSMIRST